MNELIQPMPVARDENGYWLHPGMRDDIESSSEFKDWLASQQLEHRQEFLEDEVNLAYVNYFDNADGNVSEWVRPMPDGEGWFALGIFDSEDGPVWMWVRRICQDKDQS